MIYNILQKIQRICTQSTYVYKEILNCKEHIYNHIRLTKSFYLLRSPYNYISNCKNKKSKIRHFDGFGKPIVTNHNHSLIIDWFLNRIYIWLLMDHL